MMGWTLLLYILSYGFYQEHHISARSCEDAMIEARLVRGPDLWSATCVGPDDEIVAQINGELGP